MKFYALMTTIVASVLISSANVFADQGDRDPFWPVGYRTIEKVEQPAPLIEKVVIDLEAELNQCLRAGDWMKSRRRFFMNIGSNQWVEAGDEIEIDVHGRMIRLLVDHLSTTNIVLKPVR